MFKSIWGWFKGLFANPKTTTAGIAQLAGAAAIGAGMATGNVALAMGIPAMAAAVAGGIGNIAAKDANGKLTEGGQTAVNVANTVAGVATAVAPMVGSDKSVGDNTVVSTDKTTQVINEVAAVANVVEAATTAQSK